MKRLQMVLKPKICTVWLFRGSLLTYTLRIIEGLTDSLHLSLDSPQGSPSCHLTAKEWLCTVLFSRVHPFARWFYRG